jgi:hypothetical protein
MLQQQQRVVDQLVDRALADDPDDSAHKCSLPFTATSAALGNRPWRFSAAA